MAFESLTDKLSMIFKKLRGKAKITESNIDEMLKEIRIALLEADVNFKVVKSFLENVKQKAIGQDVLGKIDPSQLIVKIVHDEIIELLGGDDCELNIKKKPTTIMFVGLQGTGKTTTAAKLAYHLKNKQKKKVLLVAGDVYRPAAIDQLGQLAKSIGVEMFTMGTNVSPVEISLKAQQKAIDENYDVMIIDTAGRLSIDEQLMEELTLIKKAVNPEEVLFLVDAASGQDTYNTANIFNEKVGLTGYIMSKFDGDARGGSALSIRYLTHLPIKFVGVGEKVADLDVFHPDRMADRILGMGDVVTLVEKAQEQIDEKEAKKTMNKMMNGTFNLDDMLHQMKQVTKLGSLGGLLRLIPGMPKITPEQQEYAEKEMRSFEIVINSMTKEERQHPEILKFSRKQRICLGSGKTMQDINKVLKKYEQSKQMMEQMAKMKKNGGGFPGGGFPGGGFPGAGGFPGGFPGR